MIKQKGSNKYKPMKIKGEEISDGAMPLWIQKFIRLFLDYQVALLDQGMALSESEQDKLFDSDTCGTMDNLADMLGVPRDQTCDVHDLKEIAKEIGLEWRDEFDYDKKHYGLCELATIAGEWPDSVYARDWITHMPYQIWDGQLTIEDALNELRIEYGLRNKQTN